MTVPRPYAKEGVLEKALECNFHRYKPLPLGCSHAFSSKKGCCFASNLTIFENRKRQQNRDS